MVGAKKGCRVIHNKDDIQICHLAHNVLLIFNLLAGREKEAALAQLTVSKEREARMQVIFLFFVLFVCLTVAKEM